MKAFATKTELLPHQRDAVEKVRATRVSALFMDMGTGKSRTAIELVRLRARKIDRVVWACPVSLKATIRGEILKHTDCRDEDIFIFDGKVTDATVPMNRMWYIVGIESLSASDRVTVTLNAVISTQTYVIVDESSYIKGPTSNRTRRITALAERALYRTILTGTPLSQGVVDLYAQMTFLSPKILGYRSFYSFARNHLEYHPDYPGLIVRSHNVPYLAAKIKPYVYQCTKDECLTLPGKLYEQYCTDLSDAQEREYEAAKDRFLELLTKAEACGEDVSRLAIFSLFTELQTICCGFVRRDGVETALDNPRLTTLLTALRNVPEDEKVIVWGKYVFAVEQIAAALRREFGADAVALYYGALPPAKRNEELERFRGDARFLVATQSCGGHGLNLQFCRYQVFYANGFKYSERLQAEDRCHRHGQTRRVTYVDLHACDTIDTRIEEALSRKGDALQSFREEIERVKKDKGAPGLKELVMKL